MGKIYFASDFHLGYGDKTAAQARERKIVRWLESIAHDCEELYLVGDVFDYWFEYKHSIPKGYVRFLGQLSKMVDNGTTCHLFVGNHDMWMQSYLQEELQAKIYYNPIQITLGDKRFYIGHGDGLGPGDKTYKLIKPIMRNKWMQRLFSIVHPSLGLALMKYVSSTSRYYGAEDPLQDMSSEWLTQFAEAMLQERHIDYFIFGHRHLPIDYTLSNQESRYINLGDWLEFCSYAVWDGDHITLEFYDNTKHFKPYS